MNSTELIIETFHQHLDCAMQSMEALAPSIAEGAELMTQSLLGEGKILCCGEGSAGLLAQHFATSLLNRFQRERPSLPALALPVKHESSSGRGLRRRRRTSLSS